MSSNAILEKSSAKQIAHDLAIFQADTFLLYVKSQNFHWNMVDSRFYALHKFLEEQYEELAEAIDLIAERIRALHAKSLGSMQEYLEFTRLEEVKGDLSADEMLRALLHDHESIIEWLGSAIKHAAKQNDEGTADLYINRLRSHQKTAWMLRSHF